MKHFILSVLLFAGFAAHMEAQNPTICRLGFTYDISQFSHWGNGKPVITKVYPYSSAEQAGLKMYDIIEAVEGVAIADMSMEDLPQLLNPAGKNEVSLMITNLTDSARMVIVPKDCKRTDAITEDQLASAFSMYSIETTCERLFTCPFKTVVTSDSVDFTLFKSFGFGPVDENNRKLEEAINAAIEKEFIKKGLTYKALEPDMLVETFYFYKKNSNFKGVSLVRGERAPVYRYDYALGRIEKFPFLENTVAESEAEYLMQLGVRLIDKRLKPGRILWECEASELMEGPFRLENYAQSHIPLMCMQYPYTKYIRNVQFLITQKSYNYTGISYDINHLEYIMNVDLNSPAHLAGLRVRDIIEKIDNQSMGGHTAEDFTAAYKQFITNTMSLRDPKTVFTDANGFRLCMFWDKFKYTQVADAVQNPRNMALFAYLYKFAPYVSPSGTNACTFYIKRGKEKKEIMIRPAVHTEMTIEIK
jgi:membrane-associated protease RseP (regulator of RpoE activity)